MKKYHNQNIEKRDFMVGYLELLFKSRLRLFLGKLKSKWTGPFLITQVFPHGSVELENKECARFKSNGKMIKIFLGHEKNANEVVETYHFDEVWVIKSLVSFRDVKLSVYWESTKYVSSTQQ